LKGIIWTFFIVSYYGRFWPTVEIFFWFYTAAIKIYLKINFSSRNLKGSAKFHSDKKGEIRTKVIKRLTWMPGTANFRFKK